MRLLKFDCHDELILTKVEATSPGPYAILSHTWGEDEVTFDDIENKTGKNKAGYAKLLFCATRAKAHGLEHCWVDTCCIKKSDSTELNEAITSMYKWYKRATRCYVYLSDVSVVTSDRDVLSLSEWLPQFSSSRWFKRGWTLQELIAPLVVDFFSKEGLRLGTKSSLEREIHQVTRIPVEALQGEIQQFGIEERLSWADGRETLKAEDVVYCLFGLTGIYMAPLYGEELESAWARFRREIQMASNPSLHTAGQPDDSVNSSHVATGRNTLDYEGFLRSLSYPEMMYRYHDVDTVQIDTCRWLLDHRCYQSWKNDANSNVLLMIRGKPGSGKSTAMKRAYMRAKDMARANDAVLGFFFNSRGVSIETKLEGFLRSVLHQLFRNRRNDASNAVADWKEKSRSIRSGWAWTEGELQSMFMTAILNSEVAITIFVDALDECESTSAARKLLKLLSSLAESQATGSCQARLKICVSSRHYPNVGVAEPLQIIVEASNEPDIMSYVKASLQQVPVENNALSEKITSRSEGIFLWAFLVLEKIREAIDDGEPRARLYEIIDLVPQRLEELFQNLIESIPQEERERCKLVIWWVLFAKRPLQLSELRDALAFRQCYSTYGKYKESKEFINPAQLRRLLAKWTMGLVDAVGNQGPDRSTGETMSSFRVQFIHESVREYILAQQAVPNPRSVATWSAVGPAHNALALSCFNYIKAVCSAAQPFGFDNNDFRQEPVIHKPTGAFVDYATKFGFEHAELAEASGLPQSYLFERNTNATSRLPLWWNTFAVIFANHHRSKRWRHQSEDHWSRFIASQITFACAFRLDSWIQSLLAGEGSLVNKNDLSEALCVVATTKNEKTLVLLLQSGADVNYNKPSFGSPLTLSLLHGRDDFVPILLAHGASVHKGVRDHSPVVTATLHSSLSSLHLILSRDASLTEREQQGWLDRNVFHSPGIHALQAAAQREFSFMEALLDAAGHQEVAFEYYMEAHHSATSDQKPQHARALESAIKRRFQDRSLWCIHVKTLNGKMIEIGVLANARIYDLKKLLQAREGPPPDQIFLSNGRRIFRDDEVLCECVFGKGSTIHMLPRMRWGGQFSGG